MKAFLDELSQSAASILANERTRRSMQLSWVVLANGDADFHDNVIFFGFVDEEADPVCVAKVPRLRENGKTVTAEHARLVELWECLGDDAADYVPRPYALVVIQELPVLLISYVPGESLTRLSRKAFWSDAGRVKTLALEAARTLRDLNRRTERPLRQEAVSGFDLQTKAEKFSEMFALRADEERTLADLVGLVDRESKTAARMVLAQGDFWHGNMIRDRKRARLMLVDWQFARWSADVSLDVYFFLLAGALSATGRGPVEERAARAHRLLTGWRQDVIPSYLSAYGVPNHYVLLPQRYGMLLCCVEKAVRPALEFGYRHPDDQMWRHLFTELMQWPEPE